MMSGSGYVTGWAPGVKSLGGVEITVGGLGRGTWAAPACARAARRTNAATAAAEPSFPRTSRREIRLSIETSSTKPAHYKRRSGSCRPQPRSWVRREPDHSEDDERRGLSHIHKIAIILLRWDWCRTCYIQPAEVPNARRAD